MANWKKSGMRIWLAALFLCASVSRQVQAAQPFDTQADGLLNEHNTGISAAQGGTDAGMQQGQGSRPVRAEAAILEVESGFVDAKGTFWKMKSGSGFLISNKESAAYIVTNCTSVSNTPGKIKNYCKKHSINTENMQFDNAIRVVITGDVKAAAEVVVKSAEKDYCVLSADNVVSQKESLKLGSSTDTASGDIVCAYGFPKQTGNEENPIEYSEMDVRAVQGAVTQEQAYLEGGVYIAHSAPVLQGFEGGPLLDADGYVIGLNCIKSPEDDTGIAYALPIEEISAVLDNFSIYYGSREIDEAAVQLSAVYQECAAVQAEGGYKADSMEALVKEMEAAAELMAQEEPKSSDLQNAAQALYTVKEGLVPKTEKITIAVIVMAVCDILLFLWLLILAVKNAQEQKWMELERMHAAGSYAGRRSDGTLGQRAKNAARQQAVQGSSARQPVTPPAGRRLRLLRQKTGQTAVLNKNQFIIGKSQTMADFCIADNQTISRKHVMLFEDNGGWYADDLNSLNGTSVNGIKVVPGQPVRLKGGDEISLSDEVFLVQD